MQNLIIPSVVRSLHNFFTSIWIGGMLVMVISFLPTIRKEIKDGELQGAVIDKVMSQHSKWVYIGIVVLAGTGMLMAGIDLNKLEVSDLNLQGGVLMVRLPDAEIFITAVDNEKSYVYDRQTGLFTRGEQDLETLARQAAEEEIYQAALDDGILDQASVNAEAYLLKLFGALGFKDVIFE